ncbi:hypothetical protein FHR24_000555 [Wenyingzhuangia heitensis]|uniref:Uncharacterized protein n=1 Tax=Wenyingzhuangia heitensis TaxID=1487859 RepID=A0ABX0UAC1_9FLAO|nr:hypothetical protein [Wenyingzhuangia heitensis]NIJ44116.1 hypothetical protein [Wenyingzhuangia heitensis]
MQKKLEGELMSLAHSILKLRKGDDVVLLKDKAYQVYEKLAVLAYIEGYVKETPQNIKSVEELVNETFEKPKETDVIVAKEVEKKLIKQIVSEEVYVEETITVEETKVNLEEEEMVEKEPVDLFSPVDVVSDSSENLKSSLAKEFENTVSLDVATDIFENAERIAPKKSINEAIMQQKNLQIDLNDRIAFVKNLFEDSQEDFNRVVSQLNTMSSEKEALSFLKMIKKDYNWDGKEIYEERFLLLIERKFN